MSSPSEINRWLKGESICPEEELHHPVEDPVEVAVEVAVAVDAAVVAAVRAAAVDAAQAAAVRVIDRRSHATTARYNQSTKH